MKQVQTKRVPIYSLQISLVHLCFNISTFRGRRSEGCTFDILLGMILDYKILKSPRIFEYLKSEKRINFTG